LTDEKNRTGYIASNSQLQFDDPPQAGAIFTAGFGHCPNGTLVLGDSVFFYKCKSGTFYNIYNEYYAPQCEPIQILMRQCDGDGQLGVDDHVVGVEMVTTAIVIPLEDGQPQVVTTTVPIPLCQIDDGELLPTMTCDTNARSSLDQHNVPKLTAQPQDNFKATPLPVPPLLQFPLQMPLSRQHLSSPTARFK